MAESTELRTVTREIDAKSRQNFIRHSLQTNNISPPKLRHTQSHSFPNKPNVPPTIPEIEITDETTTENSMKRAASVESVASKKSNTSRKSKTSLQHNNNNNGYENNAYDGPLPENNSLDNRSSNSNRSSRNPSIQSLQVQREQYCCTPKWSPCERKLVVSVGVLATIIVILVIVVGVLAGDDKGIGEKFAWTF